MKMNGNRLSADSTLCASEAFTRWFEGSLVVDQQGYPLPVYHGTPDVRGILAEGFRLRPGGRDAFFGSDDYGVADSYADDRRAFDYQNAEPHTIPLYLVLRRPLFVDAQGRHWRNTQTHVEQARKGGHDGIIIRNSVDAYNNPDRGGRTSTVFAWFNAGQAVSAFQGQVLSRVDKLVLSQDAGALAFDRVVCESMPPAQMRERMVG